MDGPDCADGARWIIDRWPVGEACRLRGDPLRCRGGDLDAATRLRALSMDDALGNAGSRVAAGYLAYC